MGKRMYNSENNILCLPNGTYRYRGSRETALIVKIIDGCMNTASVLQAECNQLHLSQESSCAAFWAAYNLYLSNLQSCRVQISWRLE